MLTKLDALWMCYELWSWLAENPYNRKCEWYGWKQYGRMRASCPCCEYSKGDCDSCPLYFLWGFSCVVDSGSIFVKWRHSHGHISQMYARQIADAALYEYWRIETMGD
jgi:hypothetical protein